MGNYSTHERRSQEDFEVKYLSVVKQGEKITDVVRMSFKPACHIKKVAKDLYMKGRFDKDGNFESETGEVFDVKAKEEPMRNRRSLKRIFKELRQLIAANCEGGQKELWVTLTYAKQTNDDRRIYTDFHDFWLRLKRSYAHAGLGYITVIEPHASGMFHIHVILRARNIDYLYIDNREMEKLWGHGMTKTERLEDIDHMGAYVIAYMSNAELDQETAEKYAAEGDIVEKDGKKYIKGARLDFYPDGMQIARHSRDMIKPEKLTGNDALRELGRLRALDATAKYVNVKEIEQTDDEGNTRTAYVQTEQYKADLPWT